MPNTVHEEARRAEIRKSILSFSWPIVAELMLTSMISIVNLSMVGHLGAFAIAAVGLTNQPVFIGLAVFQSFNIGATALVARFIGAGSTGEARKVVVQTVLSAVILGTVLAVCGWIFARPFVVFLGAQSDTVEHAAMYMKFMAVGMLFQSVPAAVTSILRGAGESKIPMRYNMISNIVNVGAGLLLINGVGPVPGMGLRGAAVSVTLAKLVACLMSVHALFNPRLPVSLSIRDTFRLDFTVIRRIMKIGVSSAGEQVAMRTGFLLYTMIIADLGTVPFAAHQIVLNISQMISNVITGLSAAASSFSGRHLGAGKADLAETYCREICRIGLIISVPTGICFFLLGSRISMIYTGDAGVILLTALILKLVAILTIPQNYLMVIAGCLRGAGDTRWPLISAVIGMVFARVLLAAVFVRLFHLGLPGAWTAALADQTVRAVLIYLRFRTGKWKRIQV